MERLAWTIAPVSPLHAEAIGELRALCLNQLHRGHTPDEWLDAHLRHQIGSTTISSRQEEIAQASPDTSLWIAGLNTRGDLVAYIQGRVEGHISKGPHEEPHKELASIYVHPLQQGSGVAQALLDRFTAWRPTLPAFLQVAVHNDKAQRFYGRNGFEQQGGVTYLARLGNLAVVTMVRAAS